MDKAILKIIRHEVFLKYVLTGAIVTFFELLALRYLVSFNVLSYLPASCLTFATGLMVSFFLRKYLVFNNHDWPDILRQFALYSLILAINTFLNFLVMYLLVDIGGLGVVFSQLLSNLFLGIVGYLFNKAFTFRKLGVASLNFPEKIAKIKSDL